MHLVMFDIDGTLIESCDFDTDCFSEAVTSVMGCEVNTNWENYQNATDSGILDELITRHGLGEKKIFLHNLVKEKFIELVSSHLAHTPAHEIDGAKDFIRQLKSRGDIEVAIATGGWEEAAKAKLDSAGFDINGLAFASSSDHIQRTKLMLAAESRCKNQRFLSKTYFGDGVWDKRACEELSYNFILVGNKLLHHKQIDHFQKFHSVFSLIGI